MNFHVLQAIVDGSSELIAALDADFTFIAFNRAYRVEFEKIFGHCLVVGDSLPSVLAGLPVRLDTALVALQRCLDGETFSMRAEVGLPERRRRLYEFSFRPISDQAGAAIAAMFVRDVTESVRWMDFALESAKAGTWTHDRVTQTMEWDPQFYRLFGIDPTKVAASHQAWLDSILDEDRPGIVADLDHYLAEGRGYYRLDYRVRHPVDGVKWVATFGRITYAPEGQPVRMAGLCVDVTELKETQLALADARDEALRAKADAEWAGIAKSQFLAAVSHDLRQPAQSLTLLSALLRDQAAGTPLARLAQPIDQAVGALKLLLDGLLDISRLDAGVVRPDIVEFSLSDVTRPLAAEYRRRAADQGLEFRFVDCANRVEGDPTLLARSLSQLLENALRFTPKGRILLGCRRSAGRLRMEVWDTGIGIADSEQKRVFDEFYQVGNVNRDRALGLGLGLAVVRRLGGLVGSEVGLQSVLGRGSCFSLSLKTAYRHCHGGLAESAAAFDAGAGAGRIVLVVEDEEIVRVSLAMILERAGTQVVTVASGEDAVQLIASGLRPNCVLADFRLAGGMNGVQTVTELRRRCGSRLPALIITGDIAADRLQELQREGVGVLYKPVMADALLSALGSLVGA